MKAAGCSRHPNRCKNNRILAHWNSTSRSYSRPANYSPAACATRITHPARRQVRTEDGRAILAHVTGDGAGSMAPGRVGTHGHQLLRRWVLDCDIRGSGQELACGGRGMATGDLPRHRTFAAHARVERASASDFGTTADHPVHRGAACATVKPLAATLASIAEYYAGHAGRSDTVAMWASWPSNPVHGGL